MSITNFEFETAPLNEEEEKMAILMEQAFNSRPAGKDYAIKNVDIADALSTRGFKTPSEARVRKIINHLRIHNRVPCLAATSNGYFVAATPEESASFLKSLKERRDAIDHVLQEMAKQHRAKFPKPPTGPTNVPLV
jgi:hypothetical protein